VPGSGEPRELPFLGKDREESEESRGTPLDESRGTPLPCTSTRNELPGLSLEILVGAPPSERNAPEVQPLGEAFGDVDFRAWSSLDRSLCTCAIKSPHHSHHDNNRIRSLPF
jgi:hypothetical protein